MRVRGGSLGQDDVDIFTGANSFVDHSFLIHSKGEEDCALSSFSCCSLLGSSFGSGNL